jgi:hypothetical protein
MFVGLNDSTEQNFTRIGGRISFPLPLCALVPTDGSYKRCAGRAAAILRTADKQKYS